MQGNGKGDRTMTAACLDAETLAAWADGGLSRTEAARVELHLGDCDRCTAMVATFARTIPETPAADSLWQRWRLQWLVPIATAATVAALWVLVPRNEPASTATAVLDSAPAAETQIQAPKTGVQAPTNEVQERAQAPEPAQAPLASTLEKKEQEREEAPGIADLRQAPEEFARTPAPAPARESDRDDARAQGAAAGRLTEAAAPPASPAAAAPTAADEAPAAARRTRLADRNVATLSAAVPQIIVPSPDPMTRWRVIGAGQVERTTNGGARWDAATLPESSTLTGGSSPAPSICWLVGRTGAIYVTVDGLRFTRVPFPDRVDFVSIQATDARRATVVTIDGRTMRTDDQGSTWIRVSP